MAASEFRITEGELYFGDDVEAVSTLLGSCVAVVVWHATLKKGGMCHIVLPQNWKKEPDNRYANCAITTITGHIRRINTRPEEYVTCLYGGGEMFAQTSGRNTVGRRNIDAVKKILTLHGYRISCEDTGGSCYRKIRLSLATGEVFIEAVNVHDRRKGEFGCPK